MDYPLLDVFWTIILVFAFIVWFWLLITVFGDLFRRGDISGWMKAFWIVFVVVVPYFGVFIYLIAQGRGMAERRAELVQAQMRATDSYIRSVAGDGGGPAAEIERAKGLLDSGAISQLEFDALKAKALG